MIYNNFNTLIPFFIERYPSLYRDMVNSCHHFNNTESLNPYHLEGSVWAHTMMVCKQIEKHGSGLLNLGALLHDIGKPYVREQVVKNEKKKVTFYNHDSLSAFLALNIMEDLDLSMKDREILFNIIALHTQVFKQDQYKLSSNLDPQIVTALFKLAKADHEGRFYLEGGINIEDVGIVHRDVTKEFSKEVTILCGLPCSGKSSFRRNSDNFIVCRDDILEESSEGANYIEKFKNANQKEVDKLLNKRFSEAKKHDRVIIDMMHMSKKSRRRSLSHFGKDYKKNCVVFLPTLTDIYDRNCRRDGKSIKEEVFLQKILSFYPPSYEEFDSIVWRFK